MTIESQSLSRIENKVNIISHRLESVESKVDEISEQKLDVVIHAKDSEIVKLQIDSIVSNVEKITLYARWGTLLVIGGVITALMNLIFVSA